MEELRPVGEIMDGAKEEKSRKHVVVGKRSFTCFSKYGEIERQRGKEKKYQSDASDPLERKAMRRSAKYTKVHRTCKKNRGK
jgi:hypothetical protein